MKLKHPPGPGFRILLCTLGAAFALAGATQAKADNLSVLHSFSASVDAQQPYSKLIADSTGRLYGTTVYGGTHGFGSLFAVNPDGSGFAVIRNLNAPTDGSYPYGELLLGNDGRLYGTTSEGGTGGTGTLFAVGTDGSGFTVLRNMSYTTDGAYSNAGLAKGSDGRLYGTATGGGANGFGTLFAIATDGSGFTVLRHMSELADGSYPTAGIIQGSDARFYGTTFSGGASGLGTLFAIGLDGTGFTVLRHLNGPADGANPYAALMQGTDGRLYGTALQGGTSDVGTVFAVATDGTGFTVLRQLDFTTDGGHPYSGLIAGSGGRLFGTNADYGANGVGTMYSIRTDGTGYTVLRSFDPTTDGGHPYGGLFRGDDGRLYGAAADFGTFDGGTLYALKLIPVINSSLTANGVFNEPFAYTISATDDPTGFDALNLPSGITLNSLTGVISGAPTQTGNFSVNISAASPAGVGVAGLTIAIAKANAEVTIGNLAQAFDGSPKSVTVTTSPAGLVTVVTYNGSATPPTAAGNYTVLATVNDPGYQGSASAALAITSSSTLQIVEQPQSRNVVLGHTATFRVVATAGGPITYQWKKGGRNIAGANRSTLVVPCVDERDAAQYCVVVSTKGSLSLTSNSATLTVLVPPNIFNEPDSVIRKAGSDATFTVLATGTKPLSYQWKKNGEKIAGATSNQLHITNIKASDAGIYTVVVTNAAGSDRSHGARLTVAVPPKIECQPDDETVNKGENAMFSVSAVGTRPMTFQWRKDGVKLWGETSNRLLLKKVDASDAGVYTVDVSNEAGTVTSRGARLTVRIPKPVKPGSR